jgi:ribonuclease P protein component
VAFAVGRSVGSAVVRNRARRRLRAVVDDLARRGALGSGAMLLVSTRSDLSELSFPELRSVVAAAVSAVTAASPGVAVTA